MKILFLCFSGLKFTVLSPLTEPLGGTESAVSYLATELAKRGHDVTLMSTFDELPGDCMIAGVRHLPITDSQPTLDKLDPDIIIVPSAPSAFPGIKKMLPRAKLILWNHMRPDQPAVQSLGDPKVFEAISRIVYVSEVQKKAFAKAPWPPIPDAHQVEEVIINNAVAPCFENMFTGVAQILAEKKCKGAYTSTPFRGLAALAKVKELPIEVYSSMKVYQSDDAPFAQMYENLLKNDCLEMKGSVSQKTLSERLRPLAFFVYPSIFPECHSIAILEAMAAGMKIITTDCAIEPNEFVDIMPMRGNLDDFAKLLRKNINSFRSRPETWAEKMWEQVQYINKEFTWTKKAAEWETYLLSILSPPQPA